MCEKLHKYWHPDLFILPIDIFGGFDIIQIVKGKEIQKMFEIIMTIITAVILIGFVVGYIKETIAWKKEGKKGEELQKEILKKC